MTGPCHDYLWAVHLLIALLGGLNTFVAVWLAHRRKVADDERRWFYTQMRDTHGLIHPSYADKYPQSNGPVGP